MRIGDVDGVEHAVVCCIVSVDSYILGVHMKDAAAQAANDRRDVCAHPHQVRRIEVRPDDGRVGCVGESFHRRDVVDELRAAHFDCKPYAVVFREACQ